MATQPSFQDIIQHPIPQISIVDVGAMAEGQERYHQLLTSGLAVVTGFEPNPEEFARLQGRDGPYRYLPVCLGKGGPATLYVTRYPGCSSLLRPDPKVIDLFEAISADSLGRINNFQVVRSEELETIRLDDIDDLQMDFIKLDTQGSELEILQHGTGKLANVVVIESEVEFIPLYRDQLLFGDIQIFLRDHGFVLHKLLDCADRPFRPFDPPNPLLPMSQLLWANAIFVRDFTRLDTYSDDGLLKAAAVLDMVYGSFDLATLLLAEYDRRRGTQTRQRYIDKLHNRALRDRGIVQVASSPCPSPSETPDRGDASERLRHLIHQAHGAGARIRLLCEAASFGAPVFVVDFDDGPQHHRVLGSFRPVSMLAASDEPELIALSAMDLIYPARLVLDYERRMALAFALCDRPAKALLLGVGGAAMWRFVRAHLPECAATLVDSDESIVAIARRWFYLDQPVVIDTGERFLARTTERFDAILVDLSDARGSVALEPDFWSRCLDALAPGGCLATNWPDYATNERVKLMAEAQVQVARARGRDCFFVTRRGLRDNLVQYLPTAEGRGPEAIAGVFERFAREQRLPDGGRGILEDCIISPVFPVAG